MRRKANRMAGGQLKECKDRGEWAELYFMMLAAGLGMNVSKPFGDSGRYDVGVEGQGGVLRVQVKSTIYKRRNGEYSLNVIGPKRKKYEPGRIDFFAVLLIPIDDWYIIPFEVMGRKNSSLHITPKSKRQKYGEYREAWHLLQAQTGTIEIQACCDDGVWDGDEVAGECVLRTNEVTGCFLPGSHFSLWRRWARIALGLGRPQQQLQDE